VGSPAAIRFQSRDHWSDFVNNVANGGEAQDLGGNPNPTSQVVLSNVHWSITSGKNLVTAGTPAALAVKKATTSIPLVLIAGKPRPARWERHRRVLAVVRT
jgi:hypothetical protein